MALTPMDIIKKHIDDILDAKWLPDGAPDSADLAIELNEELRKHFHFYARGETSYPAFGRTISPPMTDDELREAMEASQRMPIMVPTKPPEGTVDITVRASGDPMLWYIGTDKNPRRLDDGFPPNSQGFPSGREAQIALALVDVSASRLHKVTR